MSNLLDLTTVKDNNLAPHPTGEYVGLCVEVELKETKSKTGKYIEAKFTTDKGNVWTMFNIVNNSAKAQEIGRGQLKSFLKCSGADTSTFDMDKVTTLEGLKCNIVVKHQSDETYGTQAKISYFKPYKEIDKKVKSEDIPF